MTENNLVYEKEEIKCKKKKKKKKNTYETRSSRRRMTKTACNN